MIRIKRIEKISELLEKNGTVEVSALSEMFDVTGKTIREDLSFLEEMSIAVRVHGGAIRNDKPGNLLPLMMRKKGYLKEKERISVAANELIEENDVLFLDAGTTTQQLAKILDKHITVITNDPIIIIELKDRNYINLYATGGYVKCSLNSPVFIGNDAVNMIKNYNVNKYIMGVSSINFEKGLMLYSTDEIDVKKAMIEVSDEIICLADYSKFHTTGLVSFAQLDIIDYLITDSSIPEQDIQTLKNLGIQVIVS